MIYKYYQYNHTEIFEPCEEVTIEAAKNSFIEKFVQDCQLHGNTPDCIEEKSYNYSEILFLNVVQKEELDIQEYALELIKNRKKEIAKQKEDEELVLYLKLKEKYDKLPDNS